MGIRPNSDGVIPVAQPDNPETRYSDWLTDFEDSGEIVGGVWQETDAKATAAKDAADDLAGLIDTHKHVSSDITDTIGFSDSTMGEAGRIPRTGSDGFLHQRDIPTRDSNLANKLYVDQQVAGHEHTSADITDTTAFVDSSLGVAGRIPRTGTGGWLYSRNNPTHENHLARKGYVDDENAKLRELIKHAVIAVPPASLEDLPAGQVYLDVPTLTIHTK